MGGNAIHFSVQYQGAGTMSLIKELRWDPSLPRHDDTHLHPDEHFMLFDVGLFYRHLCGALDGHG